MAHSQFIKTVASTLDLSKTDVEILKALITKKRGLSISEITDYIHRSERNVRNRLDLLIRKGLLKRKIETLSNKRLSYKYSLKPAEKIARITKSYLFKKINKLDNLPHFNSRD